MEWIRILWDSRYAVFHREIIIKNVNSITKVIVCIAMALVTEIKYIHVFFTPQHNQIQTAVRSINNYSTTTSKSTCELSKSKNVYYRIVKYIYTMLYLYTIVYITIVETQYRHICQPSSVYHILACSKVNKSILFSCHSLNQTCFYSATSGHLTINNVYISSSSRC